MAMQIDFAPLEGMTDALYRRVHRATFRGIRRYYMPFVSPARSLSFTSRQQFDLSPGQNAGMPVVPQVLCRDDQLFAEMAKLLRDAGYDEVNLNLGCPSGTVTAKGKGAGMLRDPDALRFFLDGVFALSPLPVSLKTRIGFASAEEWPALLDIIVQYPVKEWILHPRTGKEQYRGMPHRECYGQALARAPFPVIYNGDLFTAQDCREFFRQFPDAPGIMVGRGIAVNPALAQAAQGEEGLTLDALRLFHDRLYREYRRAWPETAAVGRMHGIMAYLIQAVDCPDGAVRALRRSTRGDEYEDAACQVFSQAKIRERICFTPP